MDGWASSKLIDWAAGDKAKAKTKESLKAELNSVVEEFAGAQPTPVERVLAETAALTWFALRIHEAQYAGATKSENGLTIKQADFHLRRIDRTHRRLMSTLKTLATVRRLAMPALQINLARQQVNQFNVGEPA